MFPRAACAPGWLRDQGNLLNLVHPEWLRVNGQPSLALRRSEFHGSPHGQGPLQSLKDPFFSLLAVQKDAIRDNCSSCRGSSTGPGEFLQQLPHAAAVPGRSAGPAETPQHCQGRRCIQHQPCSTGQQQQQSLLSSSLAHKTNCLCPSGGQDNNCKLFSS